MKICYISAGVGLEGGERSLLDLLDCCRLSDVEVLVVIRKKGLLSDELIRRSIEYRIIPYYSVVKLVKKGDFIRFLKNGIKHIMCCLLNPIAVIKINSLCKNEGIDIIHSNSLGVDVGIRAAIREKIPFVVHLRNLPEENSMAYYNHTKQMQLLNQSPYAIAISKTVYTKFKAVAPHIPMVQIYNGFQIRNYLNQEHTIFMNNTIAILMVGTIAEHKGQLEAVKALIHLHETQSASEGDIRLTFVGRVDDAGYKRLLMDEINSQDLSVNVEFLDFTPDLRVLRENTDITLVCSSHEALGRVTIEGMLAGTLVIGTDTAGTAELINHLSTGLLYRQGDSADLADKIRFAIENRDKMQKIAKQARDYASNHFATETQSKKIINIYQSLLAQT